MIPATGVSDRLEDFPLKSAEDIIDLINCGRYLSVPATLTSQVCRELLELNLHNRPKNEPLVRRYALDMKEGRWEERNGQTVSFNVTGEVDDGQHRLYACAESGIPLRIILVFGNSTRAFQTIDKGRKRSVSDTLSVAGFHYTVERGSVLRIIWRYQKNISLNNTTQNPPDSEMVQLADQYPELEASIRKIQSLNLARLASKSSLIFCHWAFSRKHPMVVEPFFESLSSGANLAENHPILRLRQQLMNQRDSPKKVRAEMVLALVIKAWNLYVKGKDCRGLSWRRAGDNPEAFPTIE